jgi:hypothetical protein
MLFRLKPMKKSICILFSFFLFSCSPQITGNNLSGNNQIEKNKQKKFFHYEEKLNVGLNVSFNYPEELIVERIENGICIHDKKITEESKIISDSKWSIWFYNAREETIDNLIISEKSLLNENIQVRRDSFFINNTYAIQINYINKESKIIKQNIYLNKSGAIIEINNNGVPDKDFEIFSHSFKIED